MMGYEEFKGAVVGAVKGFLPEGYKDAEVKVAPVNKVNRTLDGLTLMAGGNGNLPNRADGLRSVNPTVYVNDMYAEYLDTGDFNGAIIRAVSLLTDAVEGSGDIDGRCLVDPEAARDRIVFQLINTEQNKAMLEGMPHREFMDLSVIYRLVVGMGDNGIASAPIKNQLADMLGFSEGELYELAYVNTRKLFPPSIKSMRDVMMEMFAKEDDVMLDLFAREDIPTEVAEAMTEGLSQDDLMHIITNRQGINGAATMIYKDVLQGMAEEIGSDLYIMPSSIHEVLAVSADTNDPESLACMVHEVNTSEVELGDRLSNRVYRYDKETGELSLATGAEGASLGGILTGPAMA